MFLCAAILGSDLRFVLSVTYPAGHPGKRPERRRSAVAAASAWWRLTSQNPEQKAHHRSPGRSPQTVTHASPGPCPRSEPPRRLLHRKPLRTRAARRSPADVRRSPLPSRRCGSPDFDSGHLRHGCSRGSSGTPASRRQLRSSSRRSSCAWRPRRRSPGPTTRQSWSPSETTARRVSCGFGESSSKSNGACAPNRASRPRHHANRSASKALSGGFPPATDRGMIRRCAGRADRPRRALPPRTFS